MKQIITKLTEDHEKIKVEYQEMSKKMLTQEMYWKEKQKDAISALERKIQSLESDKNHSLIND